MATHMKARELIEAGEIGEPRQIRHEKGSFVPREAQALDKRRMMSLRKEPVVWRIDPVKSGGGAYPWVFDHAVHMFATSRFLMLDEPIESVTGVTAVYPAGSGGDVYATGAHRDVPVIAWQFRDIQKQGLWVRAEKKFHNAYHYRTGFVTTVLGSEGMIEVLGEGGGGLEHDGRPVHLLVRKENGDVRPILIDQEGDRIWKSDVSYYDQAHANEAMHFVDCILHGTRPRYGGEEGIREIATTLAAIKSAVDGRSVRVSEIGDDFTAY